jgi:hypothetical protein
MNICVVSKQAYFEEVAIGISDGLRECGNVVANRCTFEEKRRFDAILVIGVHLYPMIPFLPSTLILGIQTEQLPVCGNGQGRIRRNLKRFESVLGYYDLLFEWNPALHAAGKGGRVFLPYGCSVRADPRYQMLHDIAFVGNIHNSARRQRILSEISREFDLNPEFSPGFGEGRDRLIGSAKILLNIHHYDDDGLEAPRLFDCLSRGAFLLSEKASNCRPFVSGRDFVEFESLEDLKIKIRYFLANENIRKEIAESGKEAAGRHTFGVSASIIDSEIQNLSKTASRGFFRAVRWFHARVRCGFFLLRDQLSLIRRRFADQTIREGLKN